MNAIIRYHLLVWIRAGEVAQLSAYLNLPDAVTQLESVRSTYAIHRDARTNIMAADRISHYFALGADECDSVRIELHTASQANPNVDRPIQDLVNLM
jgi:hypothetical protein